jgi:hypothetical protein
VGCPAEVLVGLVLKSPAEDVDGDPGLEKQHDGKYAAHRLALVPPATYVGQILPGLKQVREGVARAVDVTYPPLGVADQPG